MTTYETIRSLRILSHMSQEELAVRAGYKDRSSIAKIETGKVDLAESKILLFSEIFHVSPSELMGFSRIPELDTVQLGNEEFRLLADFRSLNPSGKKKLLDYSRDLTELPRYAEESLACDDCTSQGSL